MGAPLFELYSEHLTRMVEVPTSFLCLSRDYCKLMGALWKQLMHVRNNNIHIKSCSSTIGVQIVFETMLEFASDDLKSVSLDMATHHAY